MAEFAFEPGPEVNLAPGETAKEISGRSPWQIAGRRFLRDRLALAALALFVVIVIGSLLAPVYAHHVAHTDPFVPNLSGTTTVNGKVVTVLGTKIDPDRDSVLVDGEAVVALDRFYVLFNKPKGCITAVSDDRGKTWQQATGSNTLADQDRQWLAEGPVPGTNKRRAYLLFHNLASGNANHNMYVIPSDDGGKYWKYYVDVVLDDQEFEVIGESMEKSADFRPGGIAAIKHGTVAQARCRLMPLRPAVNKLMIGVAMGASRRAAIRGALAGRLISGLVTDEATAEHLLHR